MPCNHLWATPTWLLAKYALKCFLWEIHFPMQLRIQQRITKVQDCHTCIWTTHTLLHYMQWLDCQKCPVRLKAEGKDRKFWKCPTDRPRLWVQSWNIHFLAWYTGVYASWGPKEACKIWPQPGYVLIWTLSTLGTLHHNPITCRFKLLSPSYSDAEGDHFHSEVKRREKSVNAAKQMLGANHSLVVLIKSCLPNKPAQRPHTKETVSTLQQVTSTAEGNHMLCFG